MRPETESPLKRFVNELHRRSLWQVLGIYLAGAWLVLEVVDYLVENFGLPAWFPAFALALLLIGLPIVTATAFVQERGPAHGATPGDADSTTDPEHAHVHEDDSVSTRLFTWRHATLGGIAAFALWGFVAAGWLVLGGRGRSSVGAEGAQGLMEASVVVLPFADMSPEGDQEYFSDGITEEILNALAQLPGLRVPGRTTSFSYKGRNVPLRQVAEELSVDHVLEGSVRQSGTQLRITAQLIDAETDSHLWSEVYDAELADVFAIQEEIAVAIADALQVRLMGGQESVVRRLTENLDAYNLYLRGRYFWNRRGGENIYLAIENLEQAVALDPEFAVAHAALAESYVLLPGYTDAWPGDVLVLAKDAALRALELDPMLAPAYASLGFAHDSSAEWGEAEDAFRRAVELDPGYATAHHWYCLHLLIVERPEEALGECNLSLTMDPLDVAATRSRGSALQHLYRYDDAAAEFRGALDLQPTDLARAYLAYNHALSGASSAAIDEAEAVMAQPGTKSVRALSLVGYAFAAAGRPERAREILGEMETRVDAGEFASPIRLALVHMGLGEAGPALDGLEDALQPGMVDAMSVKDLQSPGFDSLRGDPRYRAFESRLGLP